METFYCTKIGGKRFGLECLTHGLRGNNRRCEHATLYKPFEELSKLMRQWFNSENKRNN